MNSGEIRAPKIIQVSGIEMNSARWEKIQQLFHDAADLPVAEQRQFLSILWV